MLQHLSRPPPSAGRAAPASPRGADGWDESDAYAAPAPPPALRAADGWDDSDPYAPAPARDLGPLQAATVRPQGLGPPATIGPRPDIGPRPGYPVLAALAPMNVGMLAPIVPATGASVLAPIAPPTQCGGAAPVLAAYAPQTGSYVNPSWAASTPPAAPAAGWGSPSAAAGWGAPPAHGWGVAAAAALSAAPPAQTGGWAPPPPQHNFKPAPALAPPNGGFDARRAVHKEMPTHAAPPSYDEGRGPARSSWAASAPPGALPPQRQERASPSGGGRGRGSTLPSWMAKGPALLTPTDLAAERGDVRAGGAAPRDRPPSRGGAEPAAPAPRGRPEAPPARGRPDAVPDSNDPAVWGRPEAPPAKQRRVDIDVGSADVRRSGGRAWGVEEMKNFDAVSEDRRWGAPGPAAPVSTARTPSRAPAKAPQADGRRRVYEYPDVPQYNGDPMRPFDPNIAFMSPYSDRGDEAAAAGWDIARKDARNIGRGPCAPYLKSQLK